MTRKRSDEKLCNKDFCPKGSWVERVFMMRQRSTAPVEKEAMVPWDASKGAVDELPTSAMAVQSLGLDTRKVYVVVESGDAEGGEELTIRPRKSFKERSACEDDRWVMVPVISLSAEIVSLRDGRLLARIDEERPTQPQTEFRRRFKLNPGVRSSQLCRRIFEDYGDVYQDAVVTVGQQLPNVMQTILTAT